MSAVAISQTPAINVSKVSADLKLTAGEQPRSTGRMVRWGSRDFRLEAFQRTETGIEISLSLSDTEFQELISKIESTLSRMSEIPDIRVIDFRWHSEAGQGRSLAYRLTEVNYRKSLEEGPTPLRMPSDCSITIQELNSLFTEKLKKSQLATAS